MRQTARMTTDAAGPTTDDSGEARACRAMDDAGLDYHLVRHGRVRSLAEAAEARGVEPRDVVKSIVTRRGDDDYVVVLVPGDRTIAWPRLRQLLGVNRMSLPDADDALRATGYERGTITPFGMTTAWPVVADERLTGRTVSLGAGAHGVAAMVSADAVVSALGAIVADVTDPE